MPEQPTKFGWSEEQWIEFLKQNLSARPDKPNGYKIVCDEIMNVITDACRISDEANRM